jgi:Cu/Zn superoxide dismutase
MHMLIVQDIVAIVAGKEIVVPHTLKGNHGNQRKEDAHSGNLPRLMSCRSNGDVFRGQRLC